MAQVVENVDKTPPSCSFCDKVLSKNYKRHNEIRRKGVIPSLPNEGGKGG